MLDQFATNDESVVSFHTRETTQQGKQPLGKGQPYQVQDACKQEQEDGGFL
jgi:hypothetical protein